MHDKNVVFFGPSDWWNMNPSSGTHLASILSKNNWVLYINPIGSDFSGTLNSSGISRFLFFKIFRKLKSFAKAFKKINNNLSVFSPIFIPLQGYKYLDIINNILIWLQIRLIILLFSQHSSYIMWIENIRSADFIKYYSWNKIIFHVSDLFEEDDYSNNKVALQRRDSYASKMSDIIICVSIELYRKKKEKYQNVHYLPHGIDFDYFNKFKNTKSKHPMLSNIKHPIIGYFGTLTKLNDIELLQACAKQYPHYNFVFAGKITAGDYTVLKSMNNVFFLGFIPYKEIALLCASFDLCLLPWIMNSWIEHCNPLKLFEYMACGKPIVSVPIKEVVYHYSDIVSVAYDSNSFIQAIDWELKNDNAIRKTKRIDTAKANSWDNHVKIISQLLDID